MHCPDNAFNRICREASELDVTDVEKLNAFMEKLVKTDCREFAGCSSHVLAHIPIPSPALTALLVQRRELQEQMFQLDWKIRDEKSRQVTLTELRKMLKQARAIAKSTTRARTA